MKWKKVQHGSGRDTRQCPTQDYCWNFWDTEQECTGKPGTSSECVDWMAMEFFFSWKASCYLKGFFVLSCHWFRIIRVPLFLASPPCLRRRLDWLKQPLPFFAQGFPEVSKSWFSFCWQLPTGPLYACWVIMAAGSIQSLLLKATWGGSLDASLRAHSHSSQLGLGKSSSACEG